MELIDALDGDTNHTLEGLSFGGAPSSDRLPSALRKSVPKASASNAYGKNSWPSLSSIVAHPLPSLRSDGSQVRWVTPQSSSQADAHCSAVATSHSGEDYLNRSFPHTPIVRIVLVKDLLPALQARRVVAPRRHPPRSRSCARSRRSSCPLMRRARSTSRARTWPRATGSRPRRPRKPSCPTAGSRRESTRPTSPGLDI